MIGQQVLGISLSLASIAGIVGTSCHAWFECTFFFKKKWGFYLKMQRIDWKINNLPMLQVSFVVPTYPSFTSYGLNMSPKACVGNFSAMLSGRASGDGGLLMRILFWWMDKYHYLAFLWSCFLIGSLIWPLFVPLTLALPFLPGMSQQESPH